MTKLEMMNEIMNNTVKIFSTRMSKEKLVDKMYYTLEAAGLDVCILNEKYLIVNGINYQFIKRKTGWEAKNF